MKVVARSRGDRDGYAHDVEIDGGAHKLVIDEPADNGGGDEGPSPTRLIASGLAGCIGITMEMYARRKGWDIGRPEVEVDVEYEQHRPSSFAAKVRLPADLDQTQREKLLAVARHCPVHRVIATETPLRVSARAVDA